MAIRITCINKSAGYHQDPHHAITNLGWVNDANGKTVANKQRESPLFCAMA
jgi:hypothetical protein